MWLSETCCESSSCPQHRAVLQISPLRLKLGIQLDDKKSRKKTFCNRPTELKRFILRDHTEIKLRFICASMETCEVIAPEYLIGLGAFASCVDHALHDNSHHRSINLENATHNLKSSSKVTLYTKQLSAVLPQQ